MSNTFINMQICNPNLCEGCLPRNIPANFNVADTGICGKCGELNEVWDLDLLDLYRSKGLSDDEIWKNYPRLRLSVNNVLSIQMVKQLFEKRL